MEQFNVGGNKNIHTHSVCVSSRIQFRELELVNKGAKAIDLFLTKKN